MLVDPGNLAAGSTVAGAIRQASQATGTSFSYLLATAQVESGLNPQAGASTSSARGLFQFVDQTWLGTMKQSGAALGYGRYAAAISRTPSGHYEVKDPAMRSQILKLRTDPEANAVMAGAFTRTNAAYLTQKLGRQPSEGELYIAHFLGAGGAARLITLAASDPNAKSTDFFAHAASANPSIFYDRRSGGARSVAQVRDILTGRYDVARSRPVAPSGGAEAANTSPPSSVPLPSVPLALVPDTAGITSAFADAIPAVRQNGEQMFHGLFVDGQGDGSPPGPHPEPLWSVPVSAATLPGAAAPPPTAVAASILDLFKDSGQGS
jgi:hypothetical protein